MSTAKRHPDSDVLDAFSLGKLGDRKMASVERHVLACDRCCGRVMTLPGDPLVAFLRARRGRWTDEPNGELDPGRTRLAYLPLARADAGEGGSGEPAGERRVPEEILREDRYRNVRCCGVGGMAVIYRAEDTVLRRDVALKVLRPHLLRRDTLVERFRRGARALARLSHPNIVRTYGMMSSDRLLVSVMEFIDGPTLADYVSRRGPLGLRAACECVRQAALGLQHAYERGVVHRDIKPQNLMYGRETRQVPGFSAGSTSRRRRKGARRCVKIIDFDLMNALEDPELRSSLTTAGTSLGTPDYIAPEQVEDAHTVDVRGDIYSLGYTLYFLLTGRPPFSGTVAQTLRSHLLSEPRPVTDFRRDVPPELIAVLERMTAKDRDDRFRTPAEVALAMEALQVAAIR